MSFLGQTRSFLMRGAGFGQVVIQRDEAVKERDDLRRRLEAAETMIPHGSKALNNLTATIDSSIGDPSYLFFPVVDRAREKFIARHASLADSLLAVKLINLLIAKHEYLKGAIVTTARPVGFMLDPANQCHLGCPSCSNSFNAEFSAATYKPWPRGMMTEETFESFLKEVGLYAFTGHFYNNHEPFLNKLTPSFVRRAADLRVKTFISSNLSFKRMDVEAIVASGLSELMIAADGVTQGVYERYRKGGRIEWVLANAKQIIEIKKRTGSPTPVMRWQYLTFKHNVDEVPQAIETARQLGFDEFNLATPNAVSQDDPSVHSVTYAGPDEHRAVTFRPRVSTDFDGNLSGHRELILDALNENAEVRWRRETNGLEAPLDKTGHRCDWLHLGVIADAQGRIISCCNGDYKAHGRMAFAQVSTAGGNIMGSADYRTARQIMVDPTSVAEANDPNDQVVCARCPARPLPQVGLGAVAGYAQETSGLMGAKMAFLYDWSRHTALPQDEDLSMSELKEMLQGALHERDHWQSKYDVAEGERSELRRQLDIALGERNEITRQRDIALGERNELRRQLDAAGAISGCPAHD